MATNFLSLLPGEGLAVRTIRTLISLNTPADQILTRVQNLGLAIRPNVGQQVLTYLSNNYALNKSYVNNLASDVFPDINRIGLSLGKQLKQFSYTVQVTGIDRYSNQPRTQHIQVISDQLLTKQQAIDTAVDMGLQDTTSGNLNEAEGEVTNITQSSTGSVNFLSGPPIYSQQLEPGQLTPPAGYSSFAEYYQDVF